MAQVGSNLPTSNPTTADNEPPTEPIENYDETGLDTTDSGGYGVNARGNSFSRANQMGTDGYKSHFLPPNESNEEAIADEDELPSGATTPGFQFKGGPLHGFVGDPPRDYASDQMAGLTKKLEAENPPKDGGPRPRRYSEQNPDNIGG